MKRAMQLGGAALLVLIGILDATGAGGEGAGPSRDLRGDPAIQYDVRPTHDPIAELDRKLQQGIARLSFDFSGQGYLRSLLEALDVPVESQVVAFSKTSFQAHRITPSNPRAIYFTDSVALGWVRGGPIVEIASVDPQQGVIFYELLQAPFGPSPRFRRADIECLTCHISSVTLGVPGLGVGSVLPDAGGLPLMAAHSAVTDHRTPMEDRWGGWYVTGRTGTIRHLGNTVASSPDQPQSVTPNAGTLPSLTSRFTTADYLSPYSDVAALMVLEHQAHMTNLLTRVGWETRTASGPSDAASLGATVRELVDYLLFVDEAPLADRVQSTSGFAERFSGSGPRDRRGRSLRELDLVQRLMRYPCSYMIYTPSFDSLPAQAKDAIYRRTWDVLSGRVKEKKYARLSSTDRAAIIEILRDTKPGLPNYYHALSSPRRAPG